MKEGINNLEQSWPGNNKAKNMLLFAAFSSVLINLFVLIIWIIKHYGFGHKNLAGLEQQAFGESYSRNYLENIGKIDSIILVFLLFSQVSSLLFFILALAHSKDNKKTNKTHNGFRICLMFQMLSQLVVLLHLIKIISAVNTLKSQVVEQKSYLMAINGQKIIFLPFSALQFLILILMSFLLPKVSIKNSENIQMKLEKGESKIKLGINEQRSHHPLVLEQEEMISIEESKCALKMCEDSEKVNEKERSPINEWKINEDKISSEGKSPLNEKRQSDNEEDKQIEIVEVLEVEVVEVVEVVEAVEVKVDAQKEEIEKINEKKSDMKEMGTYPQEEEEKSKVIRTRKSIFSLKQSVDLNIENSKTNKSSRASTNKMPIFHPNTIVFQKIMKNQREKRDKENEIH